MLDPVQNASALLANQYKLGAGNAVVGGLLAPNVAKPFSGYSLLQTTVPEAQKPTTALVEFVKQYIPENKKILSDINALSALQSLSETSEMPTSAAFVNPYTKALALQDSEDPYKTSSSLISMLL